MVEDDLSSVPLYWPDMVPEVQPASLLPPLVLLLRVPQSPPRVAAVDKSVLVVAERLDHCDPESFRSGVRTGRGTLHVSEEVQTMRGLLARIAAWRCDLIFRCLGLCLFPSILPA